MDTSALLAADRRPGTDRPAADRRWFDTGRSGHPDARTAGAEAARAALAGRRAALVIVFCPVSTDFPAMLEGVLAEAGQVPLIGCSGTLDVALEAGSGAAGSPVISVSALGGDGFEVRLSVAEHVSEGQRAAGVRAAEQVELLTREHQLLLMLCDGLAGEQHDIVRGAYSVVGASVPLAGGCAADDLTYERTFQFWADGGRTRILSDAVVAAAIGSDAPIGIGVAHGWHRVGEPMVVTSSEGGHVRTLDGQPALDVFLRRNDAPRSLAADALAFRLFALQRPLGMSRRSGEDIRVIHGGDAADGSIRCLADVPQGALLWGMESDRASLISCVDDAYAAAVAALGDRPPLGLLAFDCGARHLILGPDGVAAELDRHTAAAAGAPLGGFVTYGEIARTRGPQGMHHLTLVMVAFA